MTEFHALSLLGASSEQLKRSIAQLSSLPHIGEQRIRLVVDPTQVVLASQLVKDNELPASIVSVAGYPTGRHHTLIKASEARLAVQSGAEEIWVSVDDTIEEANTHLSELVTIQEACPDPVELGLFAPLDGASLNGGTPALAATAAVQAAGLAGFKRIIASIDVPELEEAAAPLEIHVVDL